MPKNKLLKYISNPSPLERKSIVYEDTTAIVIKDAYPKAKQHLLVIPKKYISTIEQITCEDIPLIKHMMCIADQMKRDNTTYIIGFHAIPSLSPLHMHILSVDLNGRFMKTEKHYNSFTTPFLVPPENIITELLLTGTISINVEHMKALLNIPLTCHICKEYMPNMRTLGVHISTNHGS